MSLFYGKRNLTLEEVLGVLGVPHPGHVCSEQCLFLGGEKNLVYTVWVRLSENGFRGGTYDIIRGFVIEAVCQLGFPLSCEHICIMLILPSVVVRSNVTQDISP